MLNHYTDMKMSKDLLHGNISYLEAWFDFLGSKIVLASKAADPYQDATHGRVLHPRRCFGWQLLLLMQCKKAR